ncbi:MAG TPA: FimV/HubP family polar landmark protein [Pseudomonadales bacterium]
MNYILRALGILARLVLVPVGLMLPAAAFAVSLGDEMILSRLGDPVEVEIEVLQWEDMDLERVQISAASQQEYEVFKLTWLPVLEHLNFNLIGPDLDGNVRVLISSRDPLDEPFLELLLVLRWPGGSLRREYVLLFDPPGAQMAGVNPDDSREETPAEVAASPPADEMVPVVEAPVNAEVASVTVAPSGAEAMPVIVVPEGAEVTLSTDATPRADTIPVEEAPARIETLPVAVLPAEVETAPSSDARPQVVATTRAPPVAETNVALLEESEASTRVPPAGAPEPVQVAVPRPQPVPSAPEPQAAIASGAPPPEAGPERARNADDVPPERADVASVRPDVAADRADVASARTDDAPARADRASEPAPAPAAESPAAPVVEENPPETVPDARTQVAIEVDTLTPRADAAPIDTVRRTYQVRSGDSLWNIARQFRPAGAGENLYQMLLGIHDLNRNSFINGNISLLKANALLQVPTEADIDAIDAATAQAEFDRRWETGTQRFDAAQRGEAIPLFANELPDEPPAAPIEPELPPGTEAPPAAENDDGLIMVSSADAAQPLQLALAEEAATMDGDDTGTAAVLPPRAADQASPPATADADVAPALALSVPLPASDAADIAPDPGQDAAQQVASGAANDDAAFPAVDPSDSAPPVIVPATVSRVVVTTELETELAAMRTRRETAEALARQLQESLQRAQAERAAQAGLLAPRNLPLAGGVLALALGLIAGIVFLMKLSGELRAARIDADGSPLSSRREPLPSTRARIDPKRSEAPRAEASRTAPPRTEPTLSEEVPQQSATPSSREAVDAAGAGDATQIEVIELGASQEANATAAAPDASNPDDLFARMDDMLGAAKKSPQK